MINKIICNRYKVIDHLGTGGMATVWLAEDTILDRKVAVKTFKITTNDEEAIKRFHREANAVTSLLHDNIVSIYGVEQEDEYYYLILEYVEGITLKSYMQQNPMISLETIIHIMKQLTLAINHAHQNGIIHRDIKPQNILMNKELKCKVTDFGISRSYGDTTLTQTNQMLGTVHYLSPEQARGNLATAQSDIYSLGTILFELLTGEVPFKGESAVAIALKHLQEKFPNIDNYRNDVPQSLKNIVLKATMKNPNERYLNTEEMYEDLESCLELSRLNEAVYTGFSKVEETTKTSEMVYVDNDVDENYNTVAYNEDSTERGEKKSSYFKKLLFSLIILFIVGVSLFYYTYTYSGSSQNKIEDTTKVTVPELKNLSLEEAKNKITNLNLKVGEITEVESENIPRNMVISSNPSAGTELEKNSTINLRVSTGKSSVIVGNYIGVEENTVREKLNSMNFKNVTFEQDYSDEYAKGKVMYQSIAAGTEVVPTNNSIVIKISLGAEKLRMPDLIGKELEKAYQLASEYGFKIVESAREYSDTIKENYILKQGITQNEEIEKGTSVEIIVSKGKEEVEVTVPNFVDKNTKEVETWARNNNIVLNIQEQRKPGESDGTVLSQTPVKGTMKPNSTLTITVVKN